MALVLPAAAQSGPCAPGEPPAGEEPTGAGSQGLWRGVQWEGAGGREGRWGMRGAQHQATWSLESPGSKVSIGVWKSNDVWSETWGIKGKPFLNTENIKHMNCLPIPHIAFIFDFSGRYLLFHIHICGVKCAERLFTTVLRDWQLLLQKHDRGLALVSLLGLLCSANREAGLCQRRNRPAGGKQMANPQDQASQNL